MSRSKKTQKQIIDKARTQEFDYVGSKKVEKNLKTITLMPSTMETIDGALFKFIDEELNLSAVTNNGFKKVPVIWTSTERAFQTKGNPELRNKDGDLVLPFITVYRSGINKDPNRKGIPYANLYPVNDPKGGVITVARRINQKKTAEFQNNVAAKRLGPGNVRSLAFNTSKRNMPTNKVVYETITMPLPVWIEVKYEIALRSEYQQQMNELIRPFITIPGNSRMPKRISTDGHFYEVFIDGSFADNSNAANLNMEQRNFETIITINVLGYLMGEGDNQERPTVSIRENAVEVRIPREHVIVGDIPDDIKDGFYTE